MNNDYLKKKRQRDQIDPNAPSAPIYYKENNFSKLYNMICPTECYLCKKETRENTTSCSRCFKMFHQECYSSFSKNKNSQVCYFCLLAEIKACILCNKQETDIICELCGNHLHKSCLKIPNQALCSRGSEINASACKYCLQSENVKVLAFTCIESICCIKVKFLSKNVLI